jgi:2-polyprenyl-3-methyl-5-hydroxy-6-metoxy-1,4-benzoquinol methylase
VVTYNKRYFQSPEGAGNTSIEGLKDLPCLLEYLAPKPDEKILDVGCGLGRLAEVIAEHGSEVTGIDISEYAISQAKERCKGREKLEFICMDALNMDFQGHFDKIICYHFIEHLTLPDARILLRKMCSALKDGGTLVMGLPIEDGRFLRRAVHFMATRRKWQYLGHLVSYSIREIERELVSAGFAFDEICLLSYLGVKIPGWVPRISLIGLPVVCADIRATKKEASESKL